MGYRKRASTNKTNFMKVYYNFNHIEYSSICHALSLYWNNKYPGSKFAGIINDFSGQHYPDLINQKDIKYQFIDRVEDIEFESLRTDFDKDFIESWEKKLNMNFNEFIVADRHIGHFYNTGGVIPRVKLMGIANNHENLQKLMCYHFKFILNRLQEFKPDFVFQTVTAAMFELMIYKICEYLEIKCVTLVHTRIQDRWAIANNPYEKFPHIIDDYKKQLKDSDYLNKYIQISNNYVSSFLDHSQPIAPEYSLAHNKETAIINKISFFKFIFYTVRLSKRNSVRLLKKRFTKSYRHFLKSPNLFDRWYLELKSLLNAKFQLSNKYWEKFDTDKEYIYFPLHLNPEASTMVLTPYFVDQLMIIEALSKSIPGSMNIVVKEHPTMIGKRPKNYYNKIKSYPNVCLLSPTEDNFELIKKSIFTAVITGTAGWEAILMGKSVLTFGDAIYSPIGLSTKCTDYSLLPGIIRDLIYNNKLIDKNKRKHRLVSFVSSVYNNSIDLKTNDIWGPLIRPGFYNEKSLEIKKIANIIEKRINET